MKMMISTDCGSGQTFRQLLSHGGKWKIIDSEIERSTGAPSGWRVAQTDRERMSIITTRGVLLNTTNIKLVDPQKCLWCPLLLAPRIDSPHELVNCLRRSNRLIGMKDTKLDREMKWEREWIGWNTHACQLISSFDWKQADTSWPTRVGHGWTRRRGGGGGAEDWHRCKRGETRRGSAIQCNVLSECAGRVWLIDTSWGRH